jgi:hypothetical protein
MSAPLAKKGRLFATNGDFPPPSHPVAADPRRGRVLQGIEIKSNPNLAKHYFEHGTFLALTLS